MDLRRDQAEAGLLRPRKKRKFSEFVSDPLPQEQSMTLDTDNGDDEDEGADSEGIGSFTEEIVATGFSSSIGQPDLDSLDNGPSRTYIPLGELFNYSSDVGLDYCWKGGLRKLDEELAYYNLIHDSHSFPAGENEVLIFFTDFDIFYIAKHLSYIHTLVVKGADPKTTDRGQGQHCMRVRLL